MNSTRLFLGGPDGWKDVQIQLSALQALWGGWVVRVAGDRSALLQHVSPITHEERFRLDLSEAEFQALVEACLENDLLAVPEPERPGRPDETMLELTLVDPQGQKQTVRKWAGDRQPRFEAVSRPLFALTVRTQNLTPFQSGPFQWPGMAQTGGSGDDPHR